MDPTEIPELISSICSDDGATFRHRTDELFAALLFMDRDEIVAHVEFAGVIPESYSHDSTEEKLYAKYCDWLLAKALEELGMDSSVIRERADAADVTASVRGYTVIGDAKAFRLSRTAKNQKDFKVEALNTWRGAARAEFACLVCPLYQYPSRTSQIYDQAIRCNVTLLSFNHLGFLLQAREIRAEAFDKIWTVSRSLSTGKDATPYWDAIRDQVAQAAGDCQVAEWREYLLKSKGILLNHARAELRFWEAEEQRLRSLCHEEAVQALIAARGIHGKKHTIMASVTGLDRLLAETD